MNENLLPLSAKHAKGVALLFIRFCKLDAAKLESFLEARILGLDIPLSSLTVWL